MITKDSYTHCPSRFSIIVFLGLLGWLPFSLICRNSLQILDLNNFCVVNILSFYFMMLFVVLILPNLGIFCVPFLSSIRNATLYQVHKKCYYSFFFSLSHLDLYSTWNLAFEWCEVGIYFYFVHSINRCLIVLSPLNLMQS